MAALTLKEAISRGIEKRNDHLPCNMLILRQDIMNEVRDYMAQQFMIYSSRAENSQSDPDRALLVSEVCLGLFEWIFSGVPAFSTNSTASTLNDRGSNEHKKRNE